MDYPIWLGFIIALGVVSIDYHLWMIMREIRKNRT
jgi:hypothetical protein